MEKKHGFDFNVGFIINCIFLTFPVGFLEKLLEFKAEVKLFFETTAFKSVFFKYFQVIVLNHLGRICNRYSLVLDYHTAQIACKFNEIKEMVHHCTGKVIICFHFFDNNLSLFLSS